MDIRRVLLLDDEPDIRLIASMSLEALGPWQVLEAASGADGVRVAAAWKPDLVVLDVMMPRMP